MKGEVQEGMAGTEGNDLRELKELVEFLKANGIAEFEMERPDLKVGLRFAGEAPAGATSAVGAAAGSSTGVDALQMAALPSALLDLHRNFPKLTRMCSVCSQNGH
jgi:hypothetical protein